MGLSCHSFQFCIQDPPWYSLNHLCHAWPHVISYINHTNHFSFYKTCVLVPQYYSTLFPCKSIVNEVCSSNWKHTFLQELAQMPFHLRNISQTHLVDLHLSLLHVLTMSPIFNSTTCFILEFSYTSLSFLVWVYCILEKKMSHLFNF